MVGFRRSHQTNTLPDTRGWLISPLLVAGVLALLLAACRGGATQTAATSTPTPTADSIMAAARQRFSEVNSAHFTLTVDGDAFLDESHTLALRGAEGDIARPDKANVKASVALAGATLNISMIGVGDQQFITNPLTGRWEQAPAGLGFNPAILFDPQRGIPNMLEQTQDLTLVGTEKVDGVNTDHLRGREPAAAVESLSGSAFGDKTLAFDMWVTQDTHDIVKIVLRDTTVTQGTTPPTWTLDISKQNEPVTITPPAG